MPSSSANIKMPGIRPKNRPSMEQVLEELENINAIKMTTKETKTSAKQGTNKRQEEHTKHQHRYNHHRSPNHQRRVYWRRSKSLSSLVPAKT
ncbi:hypothetical protein SLA2020_275380 [Shorea laevis]